MNTNLPIKLYSLAKLVWHREADEYIMSSGYINASTKEEAEEYVLNDLMTDYPQPTYYKHTVIATEILFEHIEQVVMWYNELT